MERQELIKKIEQLPADRLAEIERLVESMTRRDGRRGRTDLFQSLSDYAAEHAGTSADLDEQLETAAVEHLVQETSQ